MKIFREELRKRDFVITAECFLTPETDAESIRCQADIRRDFVDDARWLRRHRPNINIPDLVVQRLESATDPREEALAICAEHLSQLAAIPGVSGANIIASTDLSMIPEVIDAADLGES